MITKFSMAVVFAVLFGSPSFAQDAGSQKFLKEAIEGNFAEVEMGKLSQKQGASEGVRAFGQMLEKDHSDANQKATAVANSVGMRAPTAPNKKQKADFDKMSKLSGANFDKAFAAHMVADHKKDIKEYEKAAKKQDAVGNYAKETLPTLRKHLETAQSLNVTTTTANPPAKSPAMIAVAAPAAGVPAPAPETTGGEKVR
jgi:putative membrane protein